MTDVDVLVIGAGMAGLSAALTAAQAGRRVLVAEANSEPGGSARWSAGTIWSMGSYEELRSAVPLGDAALQRVLANGLTDGHVWLERAGLPLTTARRNRGGGKVMALGERGNRGAFMRAFADVASRAGARIRYRARVDEVARDGGGFALRIAGEHVRTSRVVIASGGFQANREMLRAYLGPEADHAMLRTSDTAKGDGLRIGLALGGATSRGLGSFYGHTMPRYGELLAPTDYKNLTLTMSTRSLLVNDDGMRFCDEAESDGEESNPVSGLYQPGGRYYMICDAGLARELPLDGMRRLAATAGVATDQIFVTASSLDGLAAAASQSWGVDRARLAATLASGAVAARSGDVSGLAPHRSRPPAPLETAPFTAVACIAGLTYCYGGLAVDERMRLRAAGGGIVEDVWVVGNDAGGVFMRLYAGGLAWALVSGRTAGAQAAGSSPPEPASGHPES